MMYNYIREVNIAYNTTEPNIGLRLNKESSALRCYMGDTGLLLSLNFDEKGLMDEEIYKKILFNKLLFNEGMIIENIVAQMLVATEKNYIFILIMIKKIVTIIWK